MTAKRLIRIAIWFFGVVFVAASALLLWLTFPGTPGGASTLKFEGFITLPKGKGARVLMVLDYLTIDGRNLFVSNVSTGAIYKIPLGGKALPATSDVSLFELEPAAHGIAIDPVSRMGYATHSEANTVDVFDPSNMQLIKRIGIGDDPDAIFYLPGLKIIYAVSGDAKLATLIDPARQSVVGTIPLGGKPEFAAFDQRTGLVYQNLRDTSQLALVDVAGRKVESRWSLQGCEGPTGLVLDEAKDRLFIGCSGNSKLAVFDLATHRVTRTLAIGKGPDSVGFDEKLGRVYATGVGGTLSVAQAQEDGSLTLVDMITLHIGAHTLAVDPLTHRVYAGYASLFLAPRVAVFSAVPAPAGR